MWRFKVTKFKNTSAKVPRKEEWLTDLPIGSLKSSCGNHIKASCKHMVFNIDSIGGTLGILPLDAQGRQTGSLKTIHCHSDFVSDFDFSPFHDGLLATGSYDCSTRIWNISDDLSENITEPAIVLPDEAKRIENVSWHPTADNILATSSSQTVKIWDLGAQQEKFVLEGCGDTLQGISWKGDGSLLATTSRDKMVRIFDPRQQSVAQEAASHENVKDSRIVWLGNNDRIATTGFSQMRNREITVRDSRQLTKALKSVTLDNSTGTLMPFFDEDTNILFISGKGDTAIRFYELLDTDQVLTDERAETMPIQVRGVGTVPKHALSVMEGEVGRLLILATNTIIPVPYQVPRKSYSEFHEDLFPDTNGQTPAMTAEEWIGGENKLVEKVSLKPANVHSVSVSAQVKAKAASNTSSDASPSLAENIKKMEAMHSNGAQGDSESNGNGAVVIEKREVEEITVKLGSILPGFRPSKFRHLKGTITHKSTRITNIKNLSKSMPRESDGFQANTERCAVPLAGPAGLIAIYEVNKPGRLPDAGIPTLQHGKKVTDFVWDPFDNSRLASGCDDGSVRLWRIPDGGLTQTLTEPETFLKGHDERIYFVRFHPLARDVIATGSYDMTVRIWNIATEEEKYRLEGHTDTIFCLSWSPDGKQFATACKDGKLRIYEPRKSSEPVHEGRGPVGTHGARIEWACDGKFLVVLGYDSRSQRLIFIFESNDISQAISKVDIDSSPLLLLPFYDEDSSTLFVTGRGEGLVRAYEIGPDAPHIFELSGYKPGGLHQGLSFLPKNTCDVKKVEFAKCFRLTNTAVEPVIFTVPRIKMQYFQDDLYPDTKVLWTPTLTAEEWFSGVDRAPKKLSLKPEGMENWTDTRTETPKIKKKMESHDPQVFKTPDEKKGELMERWTGMMGEEKKGPMPQDLTEGCDSDEWSDD